MSVSLADKPFILWNHTPSHKQAKNHICMFGDGGAVNREQLQKSNAVYFRFKQYSELYHDYLLNHMKKENSILPQGCIQLFVNHFHIKKDLSFIPLLQCVVNNVYPVYFLYFPYL